MQLIETYTKEARGMSASSKPKGSKYIAAARLADALPYQARR